jgi:hypothetical protein
MSDRVAVPEEVREALHTLGVTPASITPLHGQKPFTHSARTFVVATPEGTRWKARIARSAQWAERAVMFAQRLADPAIPVPLGAVGRVMVEPWTEGTPLVALTLNQADVLAAAELMARIHAFSGPDGAPSERPLTELHARLEDLIADLAGADVLAPTLRRRVGAALGDLPPSAPWGLTHCDLCDANLVQTPSGALVSIDNELLRLGHLDYDSGRTLYRWPLPGWARSTFLRGIYGPHQPSAAVLSAWQVVAVIESLHLRHSRAMPTAVPLDALLGLLDAHPGV